MSHRVPSPSWACSRRLSALRLPLVIGSALAILYFTLYLVLAVPNFGFLAQWQSDGRLAVLATLPDTPAAQQLQPGDILLNIDGQPALRHPFAPLFPPGATAYRYTLLRADDTLEQTVRNTPLTLTLLARRLVSGLVALGAWLVGSLILLLATPVNRPAWWVGIVTLALAVALAASEAALYGVPAAQLFSEPFLPLLALAFASLAFIPGQTSSHTPLPGFRFPVVGAIALALVSLADILFWTPSGIPLSQRTGFPLHRVLSLATGLGLLLNPLVLLGQLVRRRAGPSSRPAYLLLVFTTLAILPLVLGVMLPNVLFGRSFLPWEVGLALLLLIPAAYGYVVYRQRFLQLDLFATRTMLVLALLFLLTLVYFLATMALERLNWLPLPSQAVPLTGLGAGLVAVTLAGPPVRQAAYRLVFGPRQHFQELLARYTALLAARPEPATLQQVLRSLANALQVRQAALFLEGSDRELHCLDCLRVPQTDPLATQALPATQVVLRSQQDGQAAEAPALAAFPWAELAAPLVSNHQPVGLLLLAAPQPEGHFNQLEVQFVAQVAQTMAVAAQAVRLFQASRQMARQLLAIREQERRQLAAQLHDEPLQRLTLVTAALQRLAEGASSVPTLATNLGQQRRLLLDVNRQLRTICADLHSPVLAQGLQWAVQEAVRDVQRHHDLQIHLHIQLPADLSLAENITLACYHILVEALRNTARHAGVSQAWVSLQLEQGALVLRVRDQGRGMVWAQHSLPELMRAHHFGLVGMHEWASLAGGLLTIASRPGKGTEICLRLNISERSWIR